jgi:hypothetical protein
VLLARPECGAIATTVHFYARSKGSAHCACEDEKSEALFFFLLFFSFFIFYYVRLRTPEKCDGTTRKVLCPPERVGALSLILSSRRKFIRHSSY